MRTPINLLSILFAVAVLSNCEYDELVLPEPIAVFLTPLESNGFVLEAEVRGGSNDFLVVQRGFLVTESAFDTSTIVQGINPQTDTIILAQIIEGNIFKANIKNLAIGDQRYAVKAFIDIQLTGGEDTKRIYSNSEPSEVTGNINISSAAIENNAEVAFTLNISGIREGDVISDFGHCWLYSGDAPLEITPFERLNIDNEEEVLRTSLGMLTRDSLISGNFTDVPPLEKGQYIYIRPYLIFGDTILYGDIRRLYLGDLWIGLESEGDSPGLIAYPGSFVIDDIGCVVLGRKYDESGDYFYSRALWMYDPVQNEWSKYPENYPGNGGEWPVFFVIGDTAYIGGGRNIANNTIFREFYGFSPMAGWWQVDSLPAYLWRGGCFSANGKGYVAMGTVCSSPHGSCEKDTKVFQFTPEAPGGEQWSQAGNIDTPRKYALTSSFTVQNRSFIGTGISNRFEKEFQEYSHQDEVWHLNSTTLPAAPRWGVFTFSINGKAYIGGGAHYCSEIIDFGTTDCGAYSDVWQFDPKADKDKWKQVSDVNLTGLFSAASFSINGKGYVYGGLTADPQAKPAAGLRVYLPDLD